MNGSSKLNTDKEIILIDMANDAIDLIRRYNSMSNIDELIESIEPQIQTDIDKENISYIIGKNYNEVILYEIEDIFDRDVVPYFKG